MVDGVEGHCQRVHAVGTDVAGLLLESAGGVGVARVLPVPVPVQQRLVELLELPVGLHKLLVNLGGFLLAPRQAPHAVVLCLELVADLFQELPRVFFLSAVDESDYYTGHKSAALLRLAAVVRGQALQPGILHRLLQVIAVGHRYWRESHKRAVAVIEAVSGVGEVLLLLEVLVDGDGDVSPEADGALPASIVEAVVEPEREHVADVSGVEEVVVEEDTVRHAEAHRSVVRPHPDLPMPALKNPIFNCLVHVLQARLDDSQSAFPERDELGARAQRIANGHAQDSCDPSRYLF